MFERIHNYFRTPAMGPIEGPFRNSEGTIWALYYCRHPKTRQILRSLQLILLGNMLDRSLSGKKYPSRDFPTQQEIAHESIRSARWY